MSQTLLSLISLLYGPCNEGHRQGRFYNNGLNIKICLWKIGQNV